MLNWILVTSNPSLCPPLFDRPPHLVNHDNSLILWDNISRFLRVHDPVLLKYPSQHDRQSVVVPPVHVTQLTSHSVNT